MSAALLLPALYAAAAPGAELLAESLEPVPFLPDSPPEESPGCEYLPPAPQVSLAFYRKHTEKLLRRYLYASMLVGRAPSILNEPVSRGWASSRPVITFEDAIIFVFDVEKCLARLGPLDRLILAKAIIQDYSYDEVALLLRVGVRTLIYRLNQALDRLTRILLDSKLLQIP